MEMFTRIFLIVISIFIPFSLSGDYFVWGAAIIVLGFILYLSVWYAIFTTPISQPVTKGIFNYARHPGRLFPLIIFIGMAIIAESLIFFLLSILFISIHVSNYKVEERHLLEKYGDEYNQYLKTTPRYFIRKFVPF
jgi:protein-S-isoprenylcysteine O-methyltransferase Ste14